MILTEEGNVWKEILKEAGKEELTRKIYNKIAENQCNEYDVAAEMIKNSEKPKLSKKTTKRIERTTAGTTATVFVFLIVVLFNF